MFLLAQRFFAPLRPMALIPAFPIFLNVALPPKEDSIFPASRFSFAVYFFFVCVFIIYFNSTLCDVLGGI